MDLAVPRHLTALFLSDATVAVMNSVDDKGQSIAHHVGSFGAPLAEPCHWRLPLPDALALPRVSHARGMRAVSGPTGLAD